MNKKPWEIGYEGPAPVFTDVEDKDMTWGREQTQAAWASLRMVRDAIQELFGPIASVSSEEAVSCVTHGPELHHEAEALIEALQRVKAHIDELSDELREEIAHRG